MPEVVGFAQFQLSERGLVAEKPTDPAQWLNGADDALVRQPN